MHYNLVIVIQIVKSVNINTSSNTNSKLYPSTYS